MKRMMQIALLAAAGFMSVNSVSLRIWQLQTFPLTSLSSRRRCLMECPAQFVPVEVRQTGTRGAEDGARQEA